MNLIRVFEMTLPHRSFVIHGGTLSDQLKEFFKRIEIPIEATIRGNAWTYGLKSIAKSRELVRRFPCASFIVWSHHTDSSRWLQFTLALLKRKFVLVEQVVPEGRQSFAQSRLSIPLKRFVGPRALRIVLNSKSQVEHYRHLFRLRSARIAVIPNTRAVREIKIRTAALRSEKPEQLLGLGRNGNGVVVCVARLTSQKGQNDLIEAVAKLRDDDKNGPTLVLVGDGPDRGFLETLAEGVAPGRVLFTGYQQDPLPWLAAADVFVLPSLFEGLPGALIEAMAAEVPCVTTDIPGNRDLVIDRMTGLLVPVRSPEKLAAAISILLNNSGLARDLAANAQRLVEHEFDEGIERRKWQALLSALSSSSVDNNLTLSP